jgi:hypothetical protein
MTHPRAGLTPTFIVVGAQRAGTDSLYGYLRAHPDAVMAKPKEPHYFARVPDTMSWAAYQRCFATRPARAVGEASTSYLPVSRAPERIRAEIGADVRLVFVLREPVERLYSAFLHTKRARPVGDARPFDEAVPWRSASLTDMVREEERRLRDGIRQRRIDVGPFADFGDDRDWSFRYVANSLYRPQIERYLRLFPRAHCLFLTTDDLRSDWRRAASALYEFVGLDPSWAARLAHPQRNRANVPRRGPIGRLLSYRVVRDAVRPVLSSGGGHRVKGWLKRVATTSAYPEMPDEARRCLRDAFADERRALATLVDRDLEAWDGAAARPTASAP